MKIKTLITIGIILLLAMIPATAAETTWIEPPEASVGGEIPEDAIFIGGDDTSTNTWVEPPTETFTPSGEVIDLREPKPDYVGSIDMQPSGEVIDLRENSQKTYDEENYVPVVELEWTEPELPEYDDNQNAGFVPSEPQTLNTQLGAKVTTTEGIIKKVKTSDNMNFRKLEVRTNQYVDMVEYEVLCTNTGETVTTGTIKQYKNARFLLFFENKNERVFKWELMNGMAELHNTNHLDKGKTYVVNVYACDNGHRIADTKTSLTIIGKNPDSKEGLWR